MAQHAYIYHCRLAKDKWVAVVEQVHQIYPLTYVYAENRAKMCLENYKTPDTSWATGRAFGAEGEVRWSRRQDGQVEVTLLTETPLDNPGEWRLCYDDAKNPPTAENDQIMLLGVSRRHSDSPYPDPSDAPKIWTDSRMPEFIYPVSDEESKKRWVQVQTKTYRLKQRPLLTRMVAMEGTSDVENI